MEWQPIETAPMDGTRLLLWTDTQRGNSSLLSYIEATGGKHLQCQQVGYWLEDSAKPHWETQYIGEPTHWMPLPEPPKAGE